MKQLQRGFIIPLVLIIVAAIAIGGGVYYHNRAQIKIIPEIQQPDTQTENDNQDQSPENTTPKKPVVLSFEAKARTAAQNGECGKIGIIGVATNVQEQYEYALFNINAAAASGYICSVDLYAGTIEVINTNPICDSTGKNCHGTGALPTPQKQYESIPVYHPFQ